jgi:hypothetical protein
MIEIGHLNAKLRASGTLTGAEVNIRRDGPLDMSDENARAARRRWRRSASLLRSAARRHERRVPRPVSGSGSLSRQMRSMAKP